MVKPMVMAADCAVAGSLLMDVPKLAPKTQRLFQMTQAQMGRVREHIYRLATLLCWQNRLK
jgi:hypothetical protein